MGESPLGAARRPRHGLPPAAHGLGQPARPTPSPVRFGPLVVLTKEEAFNACQSLADAGRVLVREGGSTEADSLCSLFTLLEGRLVDR